MVQAGRKEWKLSTKDKLLHKVKHGLSFLIKNSFFNELFPSLKQEKPGFDFYVYQLSI